MYEKTEKIVEAKYLNSGDVFFKASGRIPFEFISKSGSHIHAIDTRNGKKVSWYSLNYDKFALAKQEEPVSVDDRYYKKSDTNKDLYIKIGSHTKEGFSVYALEEAPEDFSVHKDSDMEKDIPYSVSMRKFGASTYPPTNYACEEGAFEIDDIVITNDNFMIVVGVDSKSENPKKLPKNTRILLTKAV